MEGWQKEALRHHRPAIVDDLFVDYVLDHLLSRGVLNADDAEILNKLTRKDRARHLLDILPSRGPSAYPEFVESLRKPYGWLADKLDQKSINNPISTSAVATPITSVGARKIEENIESISKELCQVLCTLSSVVSACGTNLCVLGDTLAGLVNTMKDLHDMQNAHPSVIQKNSVNDPNAGQLKRDVTRLKGGNDLDAQATVQNEEITNEADEMKVDSEKVTVKERKRVAWKFDGVEGMNMIEEVFDIKENVNPEISNRLHQESVVDRVTISSSEIGLSIKQNTSSEYNKICKEHVLNDNYITSSEGGLPSRQNVISEYNNQVCKELVLNGISSPSPETELPINSPDSGMFSEELGNFSLKSPSEMNEADETDGRTFPNTRLPGKSDGSWNKQPFTDSDPALHHKDFNYLYKEVNTLNLSLKDIVDALRSVSKISDRALKIAKSVSQ